MHPSPEFFQNLAAYSWPGSVRELVNTLERALAVSHDFPVLFPQHLPYHIRIEAARARSHSDMRSAKIQTENNGLSTTDFPSLRDYRNRAASEAERAYLKKLVASTEGNSKDGAKIAHISTSRYYELLKKHGLIPNE